VFASICSSSPAREAAGLSKNLDKWLDERQGPRMPLDDRTYLVAIRR